MKSVLKIVGCVCVLALLLTACGGSGDGGSDGIGSETISTYTVTYDGNGATGGSAPTEITNYLQNQVVTVPGNPGNLVKNHFSFGGWNTASNGSGTTYAQGQTFTMGSANVTLYAKWTAKPTYTVTYNGNGSTGGSAPIDATNYEEGDTVTVRGNSGNLVKSGYSFMGWNTQADGNGTDRAPASTFAMGTAKITLYAKWAVSPLPPDANTVLLDHFDNSTSASILGYVENRTSCGSHKPAATPTFSYEAGPSGLSQALSIAPPVGQPAGSASYLNYSGGQLMSQANGTLEFWVFLTSYGSGLSLVDQGMYYTACAGWTFGMGVSSSGQLSASAWAAFNLNSGTTTVPLNTWTHVAVTWGSTGAKLYINKVLVGSDPNTGRPAPGFGGSVMLRLGTHAGVTTWIDELRISNIQRTW